ncbi:hypothetical protein PM082_016679 [Marasmius tenuissimus]|nr:hypothetical protein PM082_016679 [Marasmius tenuissimus]
MRFSKWDPYSFIPISSQQGLSRSESSSNVHPPSSFGIFVLCSLHAKEVFRDGFPSLEGTYTAPWERLPVRKMYLHSVSRRDFQCPLVLCVVMSSQLSSRLSSRMSTACQSQYSHRCAVNRQEIVTERSASYLCSYQIQSLGAQCLDQAHRCSLQWVRTFCPLMVQRFVEAMKRRVQGSGKSRWEDVMPERREGLSDNHITLSSILHSLICTVVLLCASSTDYHTGQLQMGVPKEGQCCTALKNHEARPGARVLFCLILVTAYDDEDTDLF